MYDLLILFLAISISNIFFIIYDYIAYMNNPLKYRAYFSSIPGFISMIFLNLFATIFNSLRIFKRFSSVIVGQVFRALIHIGLVIELYKFIN